MVFSNFQFELTDELYFESFNNEQLVTCLSEKSISYLNVLNWFSLNLRVLFLFFRDQFPKTFYYEIKAFVICFMDVPTVWQYRSTTYRTSFRNFQKVLRYNGVKSAPNKTGFAREPMVFLSGGSARRLNGPGRAGTIGRHFTQWLGSVCSGGQRGISKGNRKMSALVGGPIRSHFCR